MIASKSEHKKDTPNAKIRNIVILPHSSSGLPKSSPTFETIDKKSNKLITASKKFIMQIQIAHQVLIQFLETPEMNCPFGPYTHNWLKKYVY